jgi:hypothetical protein
MFGWGQPLKSILLSLGLRSMLGFEMRLIPRLSLPLITSIVSLLQFHRFEFTHILHIRCRKCGLCQMSFSLDRNASLPSSYEHVIIVPCLPGQSIRENPDISIQPISRTEVATASWSWSSDSGPGTEFREHHPKQLFAVGNDDTQTLGSTSYRNGGALSKNWTCP